MNSDELNVRTGGELVLLRFVLQGVLANQLQQSAADPIATIKSLSAQLMDSFNAIAEKNPGLAPVMQAAARAAPEFFTTIEELLSEHRAATPER